MRLLTGMLLFFFGLLLTNCAKNPEAVFTIEGSVLPGGYYFTGQTIRMINISKDAENYKWVFPDGSVSHEKSPSYTISEVSRERNEQISLTVGTKRNKKLKTTYQTYGVYISSQPSDFFSLDTMTRKPYIKFIYPYYPLYPFLPDFYSFRFLEEKLDAKFEGRVLFRGVFPQLGEYLIADGAVSVEMATLGYTGPGYDGIGMAYRSYPSAGGSVKISLTSNNRLRVTFNQVKLTHIVTNKTFFASADLIY
jgi:hypothetical protein